MASRGRTSGKNESRLSIPRGVGGKAGTHIEQVFWEGDELGLGTSVNEVRGGESGEGVARRWELDQGGGMRDEEVHRVDIMIMNEEGADEGCQKGKGLEQERDTVGWPTVLAELDQNIVSESEVKVEGSKDGAWKRRARSMERMKMSDHGVGKENEGISNKIIGMRAFSLRDEPLLEEEVEQNVKKV